MIEGERLAFCLGSAAARRGARRAVPASPRRRGRRGEPDGRGDRRRARERASHAPAARRSIIDYGAWDGTGDTLQALARPPPADPLAAPGERRPDGARPLPRARRGGAAGPGAWAGGAGGLPGAARHHRAGARRWRAAGRAADREAIAAAHRRLTHPEEMGNLFQVLALTPDECAAAARIRTMTLEILTSDLLAGTRHGFFTRRGGASSGIYAGLNCGPGSADQREAVALNRGRVAAALEVAPERLLSLHQIHSTDVVVAGPEGWTERPRADAAVTDVPGRRARHPDRRLRAGALRRPRGRCDRRGARRLARRAGRRARGDARRHGAARRPGRVGARGRRADDQPARLRGRARSSSSASATRRRATSASSRPARATGCTSTCRASCWRGCAPPASREAGWIGACTYSEPERFFSYRRTTHAGEPDYGRLISAIRL